MDEVEKEKEMIRLWFDAYTAGKARDFLVKTEERMQGKLSGFIDSVQKDRELISTQKNQINELLVIANKQEAIIENLQAKQN